MTEIRLSADRRKLMFRIIETGALGSDGLDVHWDALYAAGYTTYKAGRYDVTPTGRTALKMTDSEYLRRHATPSSKRPLAPADRYPDQWAIISNANLPFHERNAGLRELRHALATDHTDQVWDALIAAAAALEGITRIEGMAEKSAFAFYWALDNDAFLYRWWNDKEQRKREGKPSRSANVFRQSRDFAPFKRK